MVWIHFRSDDLLMLPAVLLSVVLAIIVVAERRAAPGGRALAWFFGCGALFMLILYCELVLRAPYERLCALAERPLILVGLAALSRYAAGAGGLSPSRVERQMQRFQTWALIATVPLTLYGLAQLVMLLRVSVAVTQLGTLILFCACVICLTLLLVRAARMLAHRGEGSADDHKELGRVARALQLFALAFLLPVGLAVVTILHESGFLPGQWHNHMLQIGMALFFLVIGVTYLQILLPGRTLVVGLISAMMLPLLVAVGVVGAQRFTTARAEYLAGMLGEVEALHATLSAQEGELGATTPPPGVSYVIVLRPVVRVQFTRLPEISRALFNTNESIFLNLPEADRAQVLQSVNAHLDPDQARIIAQREAQVRNEALYHGQRHIYGVAYLARRFWLDGALYEVGFSSLDHDAYIARSLAPYTAAMLGVALLSGGAAIRVRLRPGRR